LFQFFQSCFEGMKDINLICLLFNVLHGISHRYTKRYHEMNELISEKAGEFLLTCKKAKSDYITILLNYYIGKVHDRYSLIFNMMDDFKLFVTNEKERERRKKKQRRKRRRT